MHSLFFAAIRPQTKATNNSSKLLSLKKSKFLSFFSYKKLWIAFGLSIAPISIHSAACSSCGPKFIDETISQNCVPTIFISFSVPLASWKDLSQELQKIGGSFALRGIPEDSFEILAQKLLELRLSGVEAPVRIDPEAFERFAILQVPCFVLEEQDRFDQIEGNFTLNAVLREMAARGETQIAATHLLDLLENRR